MSKTEISQKFFETFSKLLLKLQMIWLGNIKQFENIHGFNLNFLRRTWMKRWLFDCTNMIWPWSKIQVMIRSFEKDEKFPYKNECCTLFSDEFCREMMRLSSMLCWNLFVICNYILCILLVFDFGCEWKMYSQFCSIHNKFISNESSPKQRGALNKYSIIFLIECSWIMELHSKFLRNRARKWVSHTSFEFLFQDKLRMP